MGVGLDGGLYRLLLLLHIMCATVGFGAVVFNGLYRIRARQSGGEDEVAILEENGYVTRVAEFLIYGVLLTGLLVSLASKGYWELSQSWLSLSMLLYLIELGLLHSIIHRAERQYVSLVSGVNGAGTGGPTTEVAQLEHLEQRIGLGWAAFDVIFLLILYLMVFTPGHVRAG